MHFDHLLTRAGDATLQDLIGTPALRLLHLLDPGLLQPRRLRDLVKSLHSPTGLLVERGTRSRLLDLLNTREAQQLATLLGLPVDPERPTATFNALRDISIRSNSKREQSLLDFFFTRSSRPHPAPNASCSLRGTNKLSALSPSAPGCTRDQPGSRASSQTRPAPHAHRLW